jgi:hypothetical protein
MGVMMIIKLAVYQILRLCATFFEEESTLQVQKVVLFIFTKLSIKRNTFQTISANMFFQFLVRF